MKVPKRNIKERFATTISICAKCSDLCFSELKNSEGKVIAEHGGYVPAILPGEHYGDYIILDIDLQSGRILNWKPPTQAAFNKTNWEMKTGPEPESKKELTKIIDTMESVVVGKVSKRKLFKKG